jgi:hypothetical protein
VAVSAAAAAYSASKNLYLSLTDAPLQVRRCFCQEGALHLKLTVLPLELAEPGALVKGERRLGLAAVLFLVLPDPVAERRVVHPVFTHYVSNCP